VRVTRLHHGHTYSVKTKTRTPYTETYTQPIHNVIMAKLYHKWERLTWKLYRFIEQRVDFRDDIPYTNRQDIRCFFLNEKNRVIIDTKYGEEEHAE